MTTNWQKAYTAAFDAMEEADGGILDSALCLNAALSTLFSHGYQLVPVEPTEGMLDSGVALALNVTVRGEGGWTKYITALYTAMLTAAKKDMG